MPTPPQPEALLGTTEPVLVINEFWNGPKSGVALFGGTPHFFNRVFDDALDSGSERFTLTPLDAAEVERFLAQPDVFLQNYKALSIDNLASGPAIGAQCFEADGIFTPQPQTARGERVQYQVQWKRLYRAQP